MAVNDLPPIGMTSATGAKKYKIGKHSLRERRTKDAVIQTTEFNANVYDGMPCGVVSPAARSLEFESWEARELTGRKYVFVNAVKRKPPESESGTTVRSAKSALWRKRHRR